MNKIQLAEILNYLKIDPYFYSIDGLQRGDDEYCLEKLNGKWLVYYIERGKKNIFGEFEHESDACKFFLKQLIELSEVKKQLGEYNVLEITQRYSL